jgi:hypothetical protein
MTVCVRILAGLTFLLSLIGLLLSVAGGVGVWIVKDPVATKAAYVFERVETAIAFADKGLKKVNTALANAADRLDRARAEQKTLAKDPGGVDLGRRFLARSVQQVIAPQLVDAHETLHKVAEAAVVINSVLEDVGNFPYLSVPGLDLDSLTQINSSLSFVESSAWELTRLLGEQGPDPDAGARLSRIEEALKSMQGLIAEYEPLLTQVRERTEQLKSKMLPWITPAVVVVSFVCFWIALSQVGLLFLACSWWRRAGNTNPRPC